LDVAAFDVVLAAALEESAALVEAFAVVVSFDATAVVGSVVGLVAAVDSFEGGVSAWAVSALAPTAPRPSAATASTASRRRHAWPAGDAPGNRFGADRRADLCLLVSGMTSPSPDASGVRLETHLA
jgi:hypothetical protein